MYLHSPHEVFSQKKIALKNNITHCVPGQQMCALCPADAQRKNLGGRCKGHGVDSRLTKWRSTTKPKCRGKWKRVKELRHCPCHQGPDYVFV